jgi:hypothetical protein
MTAAENKASLKAAFEELSKGNGAPFAALWAPDFTWTIIGTTSWSKTYRGTESVRKDLMTPLVINALGEMSDEPPRSNKSFERP